MTYPTCPTCPTLRLYRQTLAFLGCALFAGDALAWGLQTHVFLAQAALLALPALSLIDPELRRAALRLPRLVLTGACLPDLSLTGRLVTSPAFRRAHRWQTLRRLGGICASDEDRALVVGYASHLLADISAHNHFVPEHEARIAPLPYAIHALCEWAMDAHVRAMLLAEPADLLLDGRHATTDFVARGFRIGNALAARALRWLGRGERLLRAARLPVPARLVVRGFDRALAPRFDAYMRETTARLSQLDVLLAGREPAWDAENSAPAQLPQHWRSGRLVLPSIF